MKDLLLKLGKRVHELRTAKKWSQEEFAHVSGLHRTYIGQIERGEKNISFANLVKIAGVLGVTLADLVSALELDHAGEALPKERLSATGERIVVLRLMAIKKALRQIRFQEEALGQTITLLESLVTGSDDRAAAQSGIPKSRAEKKQARR